jgi:prolyl-tRNA synthetase
MAPFQVALVPINMDKSDVVAQTAESLYDRLCGAGFDVFMDDRKERPGVKFAEMELIGIPVRVTLGERSIAAGSVEIQLRTESSAQDVALDDAATHIANLLAEG